MSVFTNASFFTAATTNPPTVPPTNMPTTAKPTNPPTAETTKSPTVVPTTVATTNPPTSAPTTANSTNPSTAGTTTAACSVTRAYCPDCGAANINVTGLPATRIVNGSAASVNEYPYQVAVLVGFFEEEFQCGGSFIKKKWILTAAHCFFDDNGNKALQTGVKVAYGNIALNAATKVPALRYILHPSYTVNDNPEFHANDIALVELSTELNYAGNPSIHPICLAMDADVTIGGKAVATGWGQTSFGGSISNTLLEVTLEVISMSQCQSLFVLLPDISLPPDTSTVLCALTPYKDTCKGDSGGPLVVRVCPNRWVQIGVVSYGHECARPAAPGVYTKVSSFQTWIDTTTGSSTSC